MATVEVHGLKELGERLKALPKEIASARGGPLRVALAKVARAIRDEAKARAPVKTGNLRDNIILVRNRDPKSMGATEAYHVTVRSRTSKKTDTRKYANTRRNRRLNRVGQEYKAQSPLFYARFQEFGTSHQAARPFLRPAFESMKGQLGTMFRDELSVAIERAVRKIGRGGAR